MKLADGQSLLEKAYRRVGSLTNTMQKDGRPLAYTVTNQDYYFLSRDVQQLSGLRGKFLLEPFGRNTAPAIALAAWQAVQAFGPQVTLLVLPADHLIADEPAFAQAVIRAQSLALQGYLVTFGITPTKPETGFGYLERGDALDGGSKVMRFVEKPNEATAQQYLSSGRFLWNSGMFCFGAQTFLDELEKTAPEVFVSTKQCWRQMHESDGIGAALEIPAGAFEVVPNVSVDYAVMERSDKVVVVEGNFGWNDIGSWTAMRDLVKPDASGNRLLGDGTFVDSHHTFIQTENRFVAAVGLDNLMIIETPDAVLVADSAKSQEVKKVVEHLKKTDHHLAHFHRTVFRPWGTYTVLEEGVGFKIKRIEVKPGASLSLQMHAHRSEHWIVVQGIAQVINGERTLQVNTNESTYIPAGHQHRLQNLTQEPLVMIEVQSGAYLGEDDIVRFEDAYGRS
jgi:mannose-1-phosphate guanylyltransferase